MGNNSGMVIENNGNRVTNRDMVPITKHDMGTKSGMVSVNKGGMGTNSDE